MKLIDVAAVREQMESLYEHHLEMGNFSADSAVADCLELLDNATTIDAVPVVRCKDCKHFVKDKYIEGLYCCEIVEIHTDKDFFCALGRPKDTACDS